MIYTQILAKEKVVHFTLDGAVRVNILALEVVPEKPAQTEKILFRSTNPLNQKNDLLTVTLFHSREAVIGDFFAVDKCHLFVGGP